MKKTTKTVFKILISIVYIFWGILSPITAFKAVLALDVSAMIGAGVGILMLLAGIFGLFGLKKTKCRIFGIIIFIFALVAVFAALPNLSLLWQPIVTAILAWLYIVCL